MKTISNFSKGKKHLSSNLYLAILLQTISYTICNQQYDSTLLHPAPRMLNLEGASLFNRLVDHAPDGYFVIVSTKDDCPQCEHMDKVASYVANASASEILKVNPYAAYVEYKQEDLLSTLFNITELPTIAIIRGRRLCKYRDFRNLTKIINFIERTDHPFDSCLQLPSRYPEGLSKFYLEVKVFCQDVWSEVTYQMREHPIAAPAYILLSIFTIGFLYYSISQCQKLFSDEGSEGTYSRAANFSIRLQMVIPPTPIDSPKENTPAKEIDGKKER